VELCAVVNLDTVVSVGIWASGIGMSAVGVEMTINPPGDHKWLKWRYRVTFIALGIIFIGFSLWQNDRTEWEKKREADNRTQEQLTNEGNQRYMQGRLDSMSKMLGTLVTNSDPKQLANALRALVVASILKRTPTQSNLSNAQVKDAAHALTQKLRQLQQQMSQESEALYSNLDNLAQAPITTPDIESSMMSVAGEGRRKLAEFSAKNETRFGQVREDCINMVGLLQDRTPQPLPMPNETVSKALFGSLTGSNPVGEVADYIDQLANLVPVNR
jgi:hypothetical protein